MQVSCDTTHSFSSVSQHVTHKAMGVERRVQQTHEEQNHSQLLSVCAEIKKHIIIRINFFILQLTYYTCLKQDRCCT